jgi:hypothetical protein
MQSEGYLRAAAALDMFNAVKDAILNCEYRIDNIDQMPKALQQRARETSLTA